MGARTPAVIFDAGLGDSADEWLPVQQAVAEFTRACAYDRAGLGGSGHYIHHHQPELVIDAIHRVVEAART